MSVTSLRPSVRLDWSPTSSRAQFVELLSWSQPHCLNAQLSVLIINIQDYSSAAWRLHHRPERRGHSNEETLPVQQKVTDMT